ncbi:MAG: HD domain-containing protein [Bacteroidota bacterium]
MKGFQPALSAKIEQAVELAAQWHDLTYRKSRWREAPFDVPPQETLRVPVVAHVMSVGLIVQRAGWDEDTVAAAFLHDAVEDVNRYGMVMKRDRLVELVGPRVAALVFEVTEEKYDAEGKLRSWVDRKRDYIESIRKASPESAAISLADKLHNLWSINESLAHGIDLFGEGEDGQRLNAGPADQSWFYHGVLAAVKAHQDERLDDMQQRFAAELERFSHLMGITD